MIHSFVLKSSFHWHLFPWGGSHEWRCFTGWPEARGTYCHTRHFSLLVTQPVARSLLGGCAQNVTGWWGLCWPVKIQRPQEWGEGERVDRQLACVGASLTVLCLAHQCWMPRAWHAASLTGSGKYAASGRSRYPQLPGLHSSSGWSPSMPSGTLAARWRTGTCAFPPSTSSSACL